MVIDDSMHLEVAFMKKYLSLIYKAIVIVATVYGLFLNFNKSGFSRMIVYFTILSNIAILEFFTIEFFAELTDYKKTRKYYIVKLILLVNISITMFAFEFVVRPYVNFQTGYTGMNIRDTFVHIITPILAILDYLFFDKKGKFSFEYIKFTAISPFLYLVFVIIYGNFGGRFTAFGQVSKYPYIFMDFESLGFYALIACGLTMLVFLGMGWLIVYVDRKLKKRTKKREL